MSSGNWYANNADRGAGFRAQGGMQMMDAVTAGYVRLTYAGTEYLVVDRKLTAGRYGLQRWDHESRQATGPVCRVPFDAMVHPVSDPPAELREIARRPEPALVETLERVDTCWQLWRLTDWQAARDLSPRRQDALLEVLGQLFDFLPEAQ